MAPAGVELLVKVPVLPNARIREPEGSQGQGRACHVRGPRASIQLKVKNRRGKGFEIAGAAHKTTQIRTAETLSRAMTINNKCYLNYSSR
jgi:hypothetical protein